MAALFLALPDEPLTVSALGRRAGVSSSTAHREVERLERHGLVSSSRFAQSRVVRVNEQAPYVDDLRALVTKAYGPAAVLGELLGGLEGIQAAYLFGSWAARLEGEQGPPPRDVDLLVVGDPDPAALDAVSSRAEERLGRDVQATIVAASEWEEATSPFLRTLKGRALVPIDLSASA